VLVLSRGPPLVRRGHGLGAGDRLCVGAIAAIRSWVITAAKEDSLRSVLERELKRDLEILRTGSPSSFPTLTSFSGERVLALDPDPSGGSRPPRTGRPLQPSPLDVDGRVGGVGAARLLLDVGDIDGDRAELGGVEIVGGFEVAVALGAIGLDAGEIELDGRGAPSTFFGSSLASPLELFDLHCDGSVGFLSVWLPYTTIESSFPCANAMPGTERNHSKKQTQRQTTLASSVSSWRF